MALVVLGVYQISTWFKQAELAELTPSIQMFRDTRPLTCKLLITTNSDVTTRGTLYIRKGMVHAVVSEIDKGTQKDWTVEIDSRDTGRIATRIGHEGFDFTVLDRDDSTKERITSLIEGYMRHDSFDCSPWMLSDKSLFFMRPAR